MTPTVNCSLGSFSLSGLGPGEDDSHVGLTTSWRLRPRGRTDGRSISSIVLTASSEISARHQGCSLVCRFVGDRLDTVGGGGGRFGRTCVICRPGGGGVERTPLEDSVDQQAAGRPVLVTQQRVDEGVARRLAVGQTFGEDAPAWADGLRPEELHDSASNQAQREERREEERGKRSHAIRKTSQFLDRLNWSGKHPTGGVMSSLHFTEMSARRSGNVKPMGLVLVGSSWALLSVQTVLQVNPALDTHPESGSEDKTKWRENYSDVVLKRRSLVFLPVSLSANQE